MSTVKLKYVDRFRDRHGNMRYYFRKHRGPRKVLPGLPGSTEFMDAYACALGEAQCSKPQIAPRLGSSRTIDNLIRLYYNSTKFSNLGSTTKNDYRRHIDNWVRTDNVGHRQVSEMTRLHVDSMIAKRNSQPGNARNLLKLIRILIHFAIELGWRKDDPSIGIKGPQLGEHHTWTEEEISRYENHWGPGTPQRIAFALLLYTGQRSGDVRRMKWSDFSDQTITVKQSKTGAEVTIPLHSNLIDLLSQWPKSGLFLILTARDTPHSASAFTQWMSSNIGAAGLPDRCVTHGLRKSAATRLADAGCSNKEIQAITGHATSEQVDRYTRAAEQKRLARSAAERLNLHLKAIK